MKASSPGQTAETSILADTHTRTHTDRRGAGGGSEGQEPEYCKDLLSNLMREGRGKGGWVIKKSVAFALHIVGAVVNLWGEP